MTAKIFINYDKLDTLLQFKVSLEYCAEYLGVSADTIQRRLKEEKGVNFEQYHALKLQRTAVKLQQKAIEMALNGCPKMLTLSLKNIAGWTDKQETEISSSKQLEIKLSYEDK
jgi:hypothetical protein